MQLNDIKENFLKQDWETYFQDPMDVLDCVNTNTFQNIMFHGNISENSQYIVLKWLEKKCGTSCKTIEKSVTLKHDNNSYDISLRSSKYHYEIDASVLGYNDRNILPIFFREFMTTMNVTNLEKKILVIWKAEHLTKECQSLLNSILMKYSLSACVILHTENIHKCFINELHNFILFPIVGSNTHVVNRVRSLNEMIDNESNESITTQKIIDQTISTFFNTPKLCDAIILGRNIIHKIRCTQIPFSVFIDRIIYVLQQNDVDLADSELLYQVAYTDRTDHVSYRSFFLWELTLFIGYKMYNECIKSS